MSEKQIEAEIQAWLDSDDNDIQTLRDRIGPEETIAVEMWLVTTGPAVMDLDEYDEDWSIDD